MKLSELIKNLTDNLSAEQLEMEAQFLTGDDTYTINTIMIVAVGEGGLGENQPVLASFYSADE